MARRVSLALAALVATQVVAVDGANSKHRAGQMMRIEVSDVGPVMPAMSVSDGEGAAEDGAYSLEEGALAKGVREVREEIFEAARASVKAGVTPEMRRFVEQIAGMVNNDMKPRVVAADQQARVLLQQLAASFVTCSNDLNTAAATTTSFQTQVATQSTAHLSCRTTESSLAAVDASCAQLLNAQTANKQTACGRLTDLTKDPGTQATKCSAISGDSYQAWLSRNQVYFAQTYADFVVARDACNNATALVAQTTPDCQAKAAAHASKTAQCNTVQTGLEQLSCNQQQTAANGCAAYTSCYAAASAALQNNTATLKLQERDRKGEWLALMQIQCLLNVFVQENITGSLQVDQITACGNANYDTASLTLTYPTAPSSSPCPQAQPAPCSDAYTAANYGAMPQYTVPVTCTPCVPTVNSSTVTRTVALSLPR